MNQKYPIGTWVKTRPPKQEGEILEICGFISGCQLNIDKEPIYYLSHCVTKVKESSIKCAVDIKELS